MGLDSSKYVIQYGVLKYVKGAFKLLTCQYDFMKAGSIFSHSKQKEAIHVKMYELLGDSQTTNILGRLFFSST